MDAEFVASLARRFSPRQKALIGVSGGRDSVALLHLLHAAGFRRLIVCHLNHGLRGRASGEDARFVRALAKRLGYEIVVEKHDVTRLAKNKTQSIETAAREARHAFFAQQARKHRCRRLFLGHHADDQVETVLHQFFRGSGLAGLGGMSEEGELVIELGSGRPVRLECVRPLLGIWREQIDAYVEKHDLDFREDESNAVSENSTRNRWRHELIPALRETLDRDPRSAVFRLSDIARAEDEALTQWLDEQWDAVTMDDGLRLRVEPLRKLPVALQRRALKRWLEDRGVPGIGFDLVERVRAILPSEGAPAAKVNLPGGDHARRKAGALFLETSAAKD